MNDLTVKTTNNLVQIAESIANFVANELKVIEEPEQALELRAKVSSVTEYVKQAVGDRELKLAAANDLTLSRIRIERWLGKWLGDNGPKHGGDRKSRYHHDTLILDDLGLDKLQSSRFQAQSHVPEEELEDWASEISDKGEQLTSSHVINWGKRVKKSQEAEVAKIYAVEVERTLPDTSHTDCLFEDDLTSLWHGDAGNLHFIESETVDLIVTSPPYNIGPKSGNGRILWGGVNYSDHNDQMSEEDYQAWQVEVLNELYRVTRK